METQNYFSGKERSQEVKTKKTRILSEFDDVGSCILGVMKKREN